MISKEKETIDFAYEAVGEDIINPEDAHGCVEIWLDKIQGIMRKTLAHIFDEAMVDYDKEVHGEENHRHAGLRIGQAKSSLV